MHSETFTLLAISPAHILAIAVGLKYLILNVTTLVFHLKYRFSIIRKECFIANPDTTAEIADLQNYQSELCRLISFLYKRRYHHHLVVVEIRMTLLGLYI